MLGFWVWGFHRFVFRIWDERFGALTCSCFGVGGLGVVLRSRVLGIATSHNIQILPTVCPHGCSALYVRHRLGSSVFKGLSYKMSLSYGQLSGSSFGNESNSITKSRDSSAHGSQKRSKSLKQEERLYVKP